METTEKIARFIVETGFDRIPSEAIQKAKEIILTEGLATMLAGSLDETGRIVSSFVKELGGEPRSGVIGCGFRTSPPEAAFANGTMAHAIDYDGAIAGFHIGLLPASILSLGEASRASGKQLLEAFVVGVEVGSRVGSAMGEGHAARGWHSTGTIGTLAAAAACAKILKLDTEQTRTALSIAASQAAGLRQNFGTMTKPFNAGNAAKNGVVAAMLAQQGFTADQNIFEARFGFFNVFHEEGYNLEAATKGLGEEFITKRGADVKKYSCCYAVHASTDVILDMMSEHGFSARDVESVEVGKHREVPKSLIHNDPKTELEGKFSMQFCTAIALLEGKLGIRQFTDDKVLAPETQELIKRVRMYVVPEMKRHGCVVRLKLKDGRVYSGSSEMPRGGPESPLSREELLAKYRDCAELVLSKGDVERSIELVERLELVNDVTELVDRVLMPKTSRRK